MCEISYSLFKKLLCFTERWQLFKLYDSHGGLKKFPYYSVGGMEGFVRIFVTFASWLFLEVNGHSS